MRLDEMVGGESSPHLLFVSGNVVTMEPESPRAEAFAVRNGKFLCVGTNEEVKAFAPADAQEVDLEAATVLPGLTDCHVHLLDFAQGLFGLDLSIVSSSRELTQLVAEITRATRPGEWILGHGWNETNWKDRREPHRDLLDSVARANPVFLSRVDVHTALVNSVALDMAGVTHGTPDPVGGRIERDRETGEPTGVLVDNARALVQKLIPVPSRQENAKMLDVAIRDLTRHGLTAVHDAMASLELLELLREMEVSCRLDLRVNLMLTFEEFEKLEGLPAEARSDLLRAGRVTARTVKIFADGALGSRGALLSEPYFDDPSTRGVEKHSGEEILGMVRRILRAGLQPAIHAIGDLANSRVLDAYERCSAERGFSSARPRLEHAQLLSEQDVAKCGELGLVVSIQPPQLISDMGWIEERLGAERAKRAFLWRSLARAGATLVSGSDLPVESCDSFLGIYAAVTRKNLRGEPPEGWLKEERLSREAALRSYTLDAAYAGFEENTNGSIAAGKFADFVVIDRDVLSVPEDEIPKTHVLATFARGRKMK